MRHHLKNPHFYAMLLGDTACFMAALYGAYLLRFEFQIAREFSQLRSILLWYVPLKLVFFYVFGLYRGMWRYTSLDDLWRLVKAVAAALACATAVLLYLTRFQGFSRAVFIADAVLTLLFSGGLRVWIRHWFAAHAAQQGLFNISIPWNRKELSKGKRVLLIGAGNAGEKMLREIFDNPSLDYHVVGFLDDDSGKLHRTIHGVPVLGTVEDVKGICEQWEVQEIFICTPSATGSQMRRILEHCKEARVPFKTLPALGALFDGKLTVKTLRDVNYQDLLRRPPVQLHEQGIRACLSGKTIVVTGAGGSIGSELCRQLVRFDPSRLILVDAGESNLYDIQMELHHERGFFRYECVLARVQDESLMERVFRIHRPQVVFHAAAYKHVPMLERNPWEAVFNNVEGSRVVMEQARRHGVERFVLVSTDKAVRPTNVMGASKRTAELLLRAFHDMGSSTRFMAVRFGNVLGSSGSVVPLFQKQIERGGPVTVTHPEVTRYFMTIPEAAQLILQAAGLGEGGEIFVLEMGTPVKIVDMARDLIRLCGKRPGVDVEIVFTGLREGEKLYEELITQDEGIARTEHEKILVLRPNGDGPGFVEDFADGFFRGLGQLYEAARMRDPQAVRRAFQNLVPEYTPQEAPCVLSKGDTDERR